MKTAPLVQSPPSLQSVEMQPVVMQPVVMQPVVMQPVISGQPGTVPVSYQPEIVWQTDGRSVRPAFGGQDEQPLKYTIKGRPAFAFVDIFIKEKEVILADAGAMLWMDSGMSIATDCYGGILSACFRTCSGESCCQNKFSGQGRITFGFDFPGDMLPFSVTPGNGWIITHKSFVCGTEGILVSSRFTGCPACLCSGEGWFVTKVILEPGYQKGMFFAGSYGSLERHEVREGQELFVDGGLFFAAHEAAEICVGLAGGITTCLCGDQGFVMKFKGPAVVYTKSRNPIIFRRPKYNPQNSNRNRQQGQVAKN